MNIFEHCRTIKLWYYSIIVFEYFKTIMLWCYSIVIFALQVRKWTSRTRINCFGMFHSSLALTCTYTSILVAFLWHLVVSLKSIQEVLFYDIERLCNPMPSFVALTGLWYWVHLLLFWSGTLIVLWMCGCLLIFVYCFLNRVKHTIDVNVLHTPRYWDPQ